MVRNEEEQKTSVTYEFVMVQQGISLCHWLALPNELQYMLFYYYMVYIPTMAKQQQQWEQSEL